MAVQVPSETSMDDKKWWQHSLGTAIGPIIAGPALDATQSSSTSASGFGGSSSSASAHPVASKPASTRPKLETRWKKNDWLGLLTFHYSTFSGLVLSQFIKIEDPSDAFLIPTDELDLNAVKIVSGVIKHDGDKYKALISMSSDCF